MSPIREKPKIPISSKYKNVSSKFLVIIFNNGQSWNFIAALYYLNDILMILILPYYRQVILNLRPKNQPIKLKVRTKQWKRNHGNLLVLQILRIKTIVSTCVTLLGLGKAFMFFLGKRLPFFILNFVSNFVNHKLILRTKI